MITVVVYLCLYVCVHNCKHGAKQPCSPKVCTLRIAHICMYVDNTITLYELMHVHEYFVSKARGRHSNTCACPYMSVYMYIHMCVCMKVSVQDFGILFATVVLSIFCARIKHSGIYSCRLRYSKTKA